ncbi:trifunctional serine/threonine-protein kinase/ATP-binding protein/sensor histidine kinase [Dapis sp. BLCC M229]|uniref:trifunctional serine/threonine-protein kinase/ATP-binding protein/sensor histidine kinase n=1 Tax=Dapis sp. BLCC M229 TaxID=3400188 RepID=UPI003CFB0E2B
MKLMAKNAEERYQSALGLKYDLEKCRVEYLETGKIEPFVLGELDLCDRFLLPEKLYGREKEVQTLLNAFERVAAGQTEMMLVAGFSGIGKTAVVNEVHKPITRYKGYFIKGKFDQFNRNIPFSAFVQAFRDLMGQLLGESDTELLEWKAKILEAVGESGQVLIEVIPELERIIGKQPPVPELSGSAAQNRFNLLFEKFITVFTTIDHPLTLFLDDLQWVDSASLNLLKVLMGDTGTGYLLLLGAYRDNEVFPAHPLILTLGELEKQNTTTSTITLIPLSIAHINQLVAETLSCSVELAAPLTDLVYQKTKGNPFFTTQFLKGLHEDGLIAFNQNLGYWECDLVKVQDAALTDDVVEFMALRLHKLPDETQKVMKLAACIGNQFDLETLAIICETPSEEVAANLWSALREGLVLPQSEAYKFFQSREKDEDRAEGISVGYRFLHDRVQQAAYSLIQIEKKQQTHLKVGRLLLRAMSATERDEKIFEIVNQLNQGSDLILSETERHDLAKLNLAAAQRAKLSTAYVATVEYANKGIQLLPQRAWQQSYEFTLSLYNLGAEAACLGGEYERMELLIEVVLQEARDLLDTMKVYEARILADVARCREPRAVQTAFVALKLLGVEFPDAPTEAEVGQIFQETAALLGNKTVEELLALPTMEVAEPMAALRILATVTTGIYHAVPILMPFVVCKQVSLSIQYGNAEASAQAYAWYGVLLCSLGEIELGDRMGQLAMDILSRSQSREFITSTVNMVYTFVKPWKQPLQELLSPLLDGYQSGLETGALEYAAYCCSNYCVLSFFLGKNLTSLESDFKTYDQALVQLKQDVTRNCHLLYYQLILNLLGCCDIPWVLQGEIYDEGRMVLLYQKANNNYALANLHISKLMLCYLFYEHSQAVSMAADAKQYLGGVAGFFIISVHRFYEALSHLALLNTQRHPADAPLPQIFSDNRTELEQWAHHAPKSQMHRVYLLDAERYRVLGQQHKAMDFYDRAIAGAKVNQFIQEEALANELAAKFYLDWEREKLAVAYMQEAYYCYAQWGAKAKIDDLEKRYPQLLYPILHRQPLGENTNSKITTLTRGTVSNTSTSIGELLDLASLMKASRSLSQEIDLKGAIANFIQVIQENAGAETVALILLEEDILLLVAHVTGEEMSVITIPVEKTNSVPLTLINRVKNTREYLVLDDATEDNDYSRDDYIQKHQPKSVLCIPLIDRGQLIGILYLENNQVSGAFTSDRIEILNLLCSQAAITLQNAQLYDKEQLARQELQQALTDLQQAQLQLVQSEKMATLGNLVAGVAHEINNPVGFIGGNVDAAQEHLQDLLSILSLYQENTSPPQEIAQEIEELEPDFIAEDFPKLIASMEEGCNIIRNISKSLRTFSRTDTVSKTEFNLHDGIDSTLLILKYRLKANEKRPAIEIVKKYGDIPQVKCYPGQLNQVFMNLLANAIDALDESNQGKIFQEIEKDQNQITIETELSADKKSVIVRIADNGTGMPEEVKARIFQQGYTTKGVGKGTGLGMAIAHQIVTEKHGGMISCDSTVGQGTIFTIVIPR